MSANGQADEPTAAADEPAAKRPTARSIIAALCRKRYRRSFALPNYTPDKWWECDLFEVTDAGYFREYEVKVSRADFLADREKARRVWVTEDVPAAERNHPWQTVRRTLKPGDSKHGLLAAGDPRGPSRFWYVTPAGLLKPEDIPTWAGLIEVAPHGLYSRRLHERQVRAAPRLHKQAVDPKVHQHARGICYWRMHHLLAKAT